MAVQSKSNGGTVGLIKVIQVGKRQLELDHDTYGAMLRVATGKDSTTGMRRDELLVVLDTMKKAGCRVSKPGVTDMAPQVRNIRALWLELHAVGAVRNKNERALRAYVRRITGVEKIEWCAPKQPQTVIETIKAWGNRVEDGAVRTRIAAIVEAEEAA